MGYHRIAVPHVLQVSESLWFSFLLFHSTSLAVHGATLAKWACCGSLISLNNTNRTSVGKDKAQIGCSHAAVLRR